MNCVLATLPPPPVSSSPGPAVSAWGLDFAFGSVSAAEAKAQGATFAASYLSTDPGKNWTPASVASYHAAGVATVAVWETTANRALAGCAAGAADARAAAAQLAALGAPAGQPFTMAIDFDANGAEVAPYFACASKAEPGRVNAYGGYRPLLYLSQHHDVGSLNWQTYAWSAGQWLPASVAPLEQYLNGTTFDHDRALLSVYGQWPLPAPPPPPAPKVNHHYLRYQTVPRRVCGGCTERQVARRYDRLRAEQAPGHHPHRAELQKLRRDAGLLAARIERVATRHSVGVWGPSPQWQVFHRRYRWHELRVRARGGSAN